MYSNLFPKEKSLNFFPFSDSSQLSDLMIWIHLLNNFLNLSYSFSFHWPYLRLNTHQFLSQPLQWPQHFKPHVSKLIIQSSAKADKFLVIPLCWKISFSGPHCSWCCNYQKSWIYMACSFLTPTESDLKALLPVFLWL